MLVLPSPRMLWESALLSHHSGALLADAAGALSCSLRMLDHCIADQYWSYIFSERMRIDHFWTLSSVDAGFWEGYLRPIR